MHKRQMLLQEGGALRVYLLPLSLKNDQCSLLALQFDHMFGEATELTTCVETPKHSIAGSLSSDHGAHSTAGLQGGCASRCLFV